MFGIKRNLPPAYDYDVTHETNFWRFNEWASALKNPFKEIPDIGEKLDFGVSMHPLGFLKVYLSEQDRGWENVRVQGVVRANVYPPGARIKEDIHCHGFDFISTVLSGVLLNTRHYPDWQSRASDNEGYQIYQTVVGAQGRNHIEELSHSCIATPRSEVQELGVGDIYTMKAQVDFHSVEPADSNVGAVTFFSKTTTFEGSDGMTVILRRPDREPTGSSY